MRGFRFSYFSKEQADWFEQNADRLRLRARDLGLPLAEEALEDPGLIRRLRFGAEDGPVVQELESLLRGETLEPLLRRGGG